MAIATKSKPKTIAHKKQTGNHHRRSKHYVKSYWPYLPIAAIVALGTLINISLDRPQAVLGASTDLSSQSLLITANRSRQAANRPILALNGQLSTAAQAKAADMVQHNYWSHVTPGGRQPWSFITQASYQYQAAGENLAYGFNTADTVTNAWLHSPEHRANLLSGRYSQVGFGVAQSNDFVGHGPETVVVALYASPAGSSAGVVSQQIPLSAEPVSRLQSLTGVSATGELIVGLIGSLAIIAVLVRHGIAWRKLVNRGELFVINHPLLDVGLIALAMIALILSHTIGFIG